MSKVSSVVVEKQQERKAKTEEENEEEVSFIVYLEELRIRLLRVFLVFLGVFLISFPFSKKILEVLVSPAKKFVQNFIFTKPYEAFLANLKVSAVVAIFFSLPVFLWEMWAFVSPALYPNERKVAKIVVLCVGILFVAGGIFGYFVVLPASLNFLITNFSTELIKPMLTIGDFLSFVLRFSIAFGIAFQIPVVVVLLVATGLVERKTLKKARPWIIVGSFVGGAILTPPDALSQVMLAVPIIILWEVGLIFSKVFERKAS